MERWQNDGSTVMGDRRRPTPTHGHSGKLVPLQACHSDWISSARRTRGHPILIEMQIAIGPPPTLYMNDRAWCWNCSVPGCGHIPCIPSAGSISVLSSLDAASGGETGDCGAMREVVRASSAEHRSCSTARSAAARPTGGQARLPKIQTRKVVVGRRWACSMWTV